jgi:SAM-dependent methyltransferase/alpha-beta hydrolase superfamily lysophospholipase
MSESDRRRSPRLQVSLPARIDYNGTDVEALARSIGVGGVSLIARTEIPVVPNHPVVVNVITEAGKLELKGRVLERRGSNAHSRSGAFSSVCAFAIAFDPLEFVAEQVLMSLLDGLCEKTLSFTLSVHGIGAGQSSLRQMHRCESERRNMPRIRVTLPVIVATSLTDEQIYPTAEPNSFSSTECDESVMGTHGASDRSSSQSFTINISTTGVCIETSVEPRRLDDPVRIILNVPASFSATDHSLELEARILWVRDMQQGRARYRMGMCFVSEATDIQRQIAALLGELLLAAEDFDALLPSVGAIVSEQVECRNARGQRIVGYLDQPENALPGCPAVLICPDYAESKQTYVALAYYLAANGFHVLRYDHSNHVGESDGDAGNTTMSGFRADLEAMLGMLAERTGGSVGIIASGVAARVALKAAALGARTQLLILLSSLVDLQEACLATHHDDFVISFLRGKKRGVSNLFGLKIDADRFLEDAISEGYADLRTTQRDARQVQVPVVFFCAETESGGGRASVEQVIGAMQHTAVQLHSLPHSVRRLHDDPRKEWAMFRQIVSLCIDHLCPAESGRTIIDPPELVIGRQNRLERQRGKTRPRPYSKTNNGDPCMEHFHCLANVPEYWHLLDQIGRLIEPLTTGAAILDVGCGSGNFGMYLLLEELYHRRTSPDAPSRGLRYVGMERESAVLQQARQNFSVLVPAVNGTRRTTQRTVLSLTSADLNRTLPFSDSQFQAIVCNLALGYAEDAVFSIRELLRVLAPGGRIVVSSLKPYADLMEIYRNFRVRTSHAEELEEAERLLDTTSRIKQAESDGLFRSFRPDELAMLLMMSGATQPRITSAFGNQAYVMVAEKQEERARVGQCAGQGTERVVDCVQYQRAAGG